MKKNIAAIDLFCGAGGLSHGFFLEGLKVNAGIDMDPACKFPYEKNNNAIFLQEDIKNISGKDLNELFGKTKIRVLAGCAPCQPFSTYAQRYDQKNDSKWGLLYQFSRLVRESTPDIVTMENVTTVTKHSVFKSFIKTLEKSGYFVSCNIINSSLYGSPQARKRMVLLASRHGEIKMIPPTHSVPITVKDAIGHLRPLKAGESSPGDRC